MFLQVTRVSAPAGTEFQFANHLTSSMCRSFSVPHDTLTRPIPIPSFSEILLPLTSMNSGLCWPFKTLQDMVTWSDASSLKYSALLLLTLWGVSQWLTLSSCLSPGGLLSLLPSLVSSPLLTGFLPPFPNTCTPLFTSSGLDHTPGASLPSNHQGVFLKRNLRSHI